MVGTGVEVTQVGRCGFAAQPTLSGLDHTVNRSRPLRFAAPPIGAS